jgi:hypothetical protein
MPGSKRRAAAAKKLRQSATAPGAAVHLWGIACHGSNRARAVDDAPAPASDTHDSSLAPATHQKRRQHERNPAGGSVIRPPTVRWDWAAVEWISGSCGSPQMIG